MSGKIRILIVSEAASSHTARWINQLEGTEFEPHLFQAGPPSGINPLLRYGVVHYPGETSPPAGVELRPYCPEPDSGEALACAPALAGLLERLEPALIHSHGLNINWRNLMLPVAQVLAGLSWTDRWPWLYSSWGTDLDFWPGMSSEHSKDVADVLPLCRFMTNECLRDTLLARRFGFRGNFLGLFPDYGGVDFAELESLGALPAPKGRKGIFLKGRDVGGVGGDPVGRAMVAMDAFELAGDCLSDVPILVAQASPNVRDRVRELARSGFRIRVLDHLPYGELLRAMASCSIFMAMTSNDGLPSTLVEAMSMGLFPIHSDLEPIREWVDNGFNGLLVPHDDAQETARALRWALGHDEEVLRGAKENESLMRRRMDVSLVRQATAGLYRTVARAGLDAATGLPIEKIATTDSLLRGDDARALSERYWLGRGIITGGLQ